MKQSCVKLNIFVVSIWYKSRTNMKNANYDNAKHLVEVEDNILAAFTVSLERDNHMENLTIAKNAKITENFVNSIF